MRTVYADQGSSTEKALDSISAAFARSKRAVVLVGAGISTNAGIPDFRSAGTGLYARDASSSKHASSSRGGSSSSSSSRPTTLKGADMFNASVYRSPETANQHLRFLAAFKESLDGIVDRCQTANKPATGTHDFVRTLKKKGKLLRVYTQNIDGLEGVETGLERVPLGGITPTQEAVNANAKGKGKSKATASVDGDFVQLHGTLWSVRCTSCAFVRAYEEDDHEAFSEGNVGACPACEARASIRSARGQRSLSSLQKAFLRPAIILYDEPAPGSSAFEIGDLSLADTDPHPSRGADLMLVMGTSLKIPGFKALVKQFAKTVRAKGGTCVLVNRDEMGSKSEWKSVFDYEVVMDSDAFVSHVVEGWKRHRPQDWTGRQSNLNDMFSTQKKTISLVSSKIPPKKREPLADLSQNAISGRSSTPGRPQLPASPPLSARKRPRAASFFTSYKDSDNDDSDGSDVEIVSSPRAGSPRKRAGSIVVAATPTKKRSSLAGPSPSSSNGLLTPQSSKRGANPAGRQTRSLARLSSAAVCARAETDDDAEESEEDEGPDSQDSGLFSPPPSTGKDKQKRHPPTRLVSMVSTAALRPFKVFRSSRAMTPTPAGR